MNRSCLKQDHIWLPYTQMKYAAPPFQVTSAEGCYLTLSDGSKILDGISSWWSVCHGYRNLEITNAMVRQIHNLPHVMFSGLAHEASYNLAAQLTKITPPGLERVFFSDSGSVGVEVAMKMAVQYHHNLGNTKKNSFIYFKNGYHGDTMGCMSVSDSSCIHGSTFSRYQPSQYMLDLKQDAETLATQIRSLRDGVAAIIIEPLLQAAGGMRIHSPQTLQSVHQIADENDILFIADEVATGFGRTGRMFACEQANITPDIMVVGKALTGGFCGLAATLTTAKVFDAFLSEEKSTALMHGPTFMANPIACVAASASIVLFQTEPRIQQVFAISQQLASELENFRTLQCVIDVRVLGAVGVIEVRPDCIIDDNFVLKAKNKGAWIKPLGQVIYLMPPFVITQDELSNLINVIFTILQEM